MSVEVNEVIVVTKRLKKREKCYTSFDDSPVIQKCSQRTRSLSYSQNILFATLYRESCGK